MPNPNVKTRESCRSCNSEKLAEIISFGEQSVPNFVDTPDDKGYTGPLDLILCEECGLLQLRDTFNQDLLYRKYWYKSSISSTMVRSLAQVVDSTEKLVMLRQGDIVVDVGSNDGTTLRQFKSKGIVKVGFEPSNLWELGKQEGAIIIHDYFNQDSFKRELGTKKAKIITTIAMFYDLEDPNRFVEDIRSCLDADGVWVIQMNYLGKMLEKNTFDNISHEHLEYYSLLSLENLINRHGMEAFDIEINEVNGGSFRIYIRQKGSKISGFEGAEARLDKQRSWEASMSIDKKETYLRFAERIKKTRDDLAKLLNEEKRKGKKIFIYGASNRGFVVLLFANITNQIVDKATDLNSEKWGKYIVGTGIPIISIEEYRKEKPDYLFVLPYHFIKEIANQESEFLKQGGKMIVAIPEVEVIDYKKAESYG